jgi:hypothetical protein
MIAEGLWAIYGFTVTPRLAQRKPAVRFATANNVSRQRHRRQVTVGLLGGCDQGNGLVHAPLDRRITGDPPNARRGLDPLVQPLVLPGCAGVLAGIGLGREPEIVEHVAGGRISEQPPGFVERHFGQLSEAVGPEAFGPSHGVERQRTQLRVRAVAMVDDIGGCRQTVGGGRGERGQHGEECGRQTRREGLHEVVILESFNARTGCCWAWRRKAESLGGG